MHLNIETIHIAGTSLNESDSLYETKSHKRNPKKKAISPISPRRDTSVPVNHKTTTKTFIIKFLKKKYKYTCMYIYTEK